MTVNEPFLPIDTLTAEMLLAKQPEKDEKLAAIFTELAAAFRNGKLSITLSSPALAEKLALNPCLICADGQVYLERSWYILEKINGRLKELKEAPVELAIDQMSVGASLQALSLLPEQKAAIAHSLKASVSCIWGGPGTGKTYTAGWLVQLFSSFFPQAKIVLTAPTGKACANLSVSIQRACQRLFETKTLHALLGIRRMDATRPRYAPALLPYDLLLVDESSMIDAALFLKLLEQVKPGARIVFLGDPNQLAPVEAGAPFAALVAANVHTAGKLITTKRQEEGDILTLANLVLAGAADAALDCLSSSSSLSFLSIDDEEAVVKRLYTHRPQLVPGDIAASFKALQKTRILSPFRTGKFGIQHINELMKTPSFLPVLITQNDYHLNLTNGQVGLIDKTDAYFEDFAAPALHPAQYRQIPEILLPAYEPAFCLSVHKSQGSEFDEVLLLLPEGSERFDRRLLYTAITRARKRFTLCTTPATLQACLATPS